MFYLDDEVYYELEDSQAGLCVERSDGALSWVLVKISRRDVRPASSVSSISDVDPSECLCLEYQMRGDVPGMEWFGLKTAAVSHSD